MINNTYVTTSTVSGLGVFASKDILKHFVIEECKALQLPLDFPDYTPLWDYQIRWDSLRDCVCSGNGMLYNHSETPNACMLRDYAKGQIILLAIEDIQKDTEILIKYACPVWWK